MATIQIRDIPDDVHEALQRRARDAGQSLQAYMREWVSGRVRSEGRRAALLAEYEEFLQANPAPAMTVEEILEARDADRR